ncbi:MAG: NfeD family protein [Spirochaetales bacterium]|nr:NfeD family protein [Spirochaetales bacterium]
MGEPWFIWAVIGVACIGFEMLLPGFVIFFFGTGALATALCSLVPFIGNRLWLQILLFVIFSICALIFLRRHFTRIFEGSVFNPSKTVGPEDGLGDMCEVTEDILPPREGRIRFKGTTWKARSSGGSFHTGESARIEGREGMTYIVSVATNSTGGTT